MSRPRRFYAPDLSGPRVELDAVETHHLLHVLRLPEGAEVELFDGRGRAARGVVALSGEGAVHVCLTDELGSVDSPLDLSVALAVPKAERMSFAVQKLTELGVTRLIPLVAERSTTGDADKLASRLERWRRIALEATKQSGRSRLPEVDSPLDVAALLEESETASVLVAHPGSPPLSLSLGGLAGEGRLVVAVGPEGGWADSELTLARRRSALLVGLGPRVLRTETAAIAAATLVQAHLGDWGEPRSGERTPRQPRSS